MNVRRNCSLDGIFALSPSAFCRKRTETPDRLLHAHVCKAGRRQRFGQSTFGCPE
jgi:hypothetical protein